jgi:hypothetical protein
MQIAFVFLILCSMAGAVIMEIIYGHEVKSIDDVFLQIASKGGRTIAAAGPVGSHIVDLIPPCKQELLTISHRVYYDNHTQYVSCLIGSQVRDSSTSLLALERTWPRCVQLLSIT